MAKRTKTKNPQPQPETVDHPELTTREARVAIGVANGKTYQEIADANDIVFETVRSIVDRLRDKTGYRRKPQLAVWATTQMEWLLGVAAGNAEDRKGD